MAVVTSQATSSQFPTRPDNPLAGFGPNEWIVEDMYQRYLADPGSVDPAWHDFFADYRPATADSAVGPAASTVVAPATQAPPVGTPASPAAGKPDTPPPTGVAAPSVTAPRVAAPGVTSPATTTPGRTAPGREALTRGQPPILISHRGDQGPAVLSQS